MAICLSEESIVKIRAGLPVYKSIKRMVDKCKEKAFLCETFQKTFDGFYKIRRDAEWRKKYFQFMHKHFNDNPSDKPSFEATLGALRGFGKDSVEPSFASKLLHTLDNDLPIWDSIVTVFLEKENVIVKPKRCDADYEKKCAATYEKMVNWYKSDKAKEYAAYFETIFPGEPISEAKKIDFILWGLGAENDDPCSRCTRK